MSSSSPFARRAAALVLVLAAAALAGGAGAMDRLRAWSGEPDLCPFRARHGVDCLGCGGTRAFADVARGRIAAGFARNPVGAMSAALAWTTALAAAVSLARGRLATVAWTLAAGTALLAVTFAWHAVAWWRALPPGIDLW
jgi:hypothetical protein